MSLKKLKNIKTLVCNSPMVQITYKFEDFVGKVFAKCEWYSLTGSIKDKVAYQIYFDAIKNGLLHTGDKIVEVTSGNMGISLAAIGNLLDLDVTIIMPKNMSKERQKLLKMYGAKLVLVEDFKQAFDLCEEYIKKGYFCSKQFENKSNIKAHQILTSKEIMRKVWNKDVKTFVAGVGTSGTLSGVGLMLKNCNFKIVGIEPENARILSCKKPYMCHKLQGLSDQKQPELFHKNLLDKIIQIKDDDALAMAQKLCKKLSLGVGISSGANFLGAVLCKENAVTVFADDNKKYLSTDLTKSTTSSLVDKIELIDLKTI